MFGRCIYEDALTERKLQSLTLCSLLLATLQLHGAPTDCLYNTSHILSTPSAPTDCLYNTSHTLSTSTITTSYINVQCSLTESYHLIHWLTESCYLTQPLTECCQLTQSLTGSCHTGSVTNRMLPPLTTTSPDSTHSVTAITDHDSKSYLPSVTST